MPIELTLEQIEYLEKHCNNEIHSLRNAPHVSFFNKRLDIKKINFLLELRSRLSAPFSPSFCSQVGEGESSELAIQQVYDSLDSATKSVSRSTGSRPYWDR